MPDKPSGKEYEEMLRCKDPALQRAMAEELFWRSRRARNIDSGRSVSAVQREQCERDASAAALLGFFVFLAVGGTIALLIAWLVG